MPAQVVARRRRFFFSNIPIMLVRNFEKIAQKSKLV
uniref:Uncharacterized protein n=1 Tax=Arundo donax TaxID=35708 RepID=A0A0A9CE95_ARUDO